MALVRRSVAILNDFLSTNAFDPTGINVKVLKEPSTGLGGNLLVENTLYLNNTSVDSFNIIGGGIFGGVTTFGDTTAVTSSSAGGGLVALQDARIAGKLLGKVLATDAATIATTDIPTSTSGITFAGPVNFANTGTATFTNSNTGASAGAAPYQIQGDLTTQKNLWVQANENIGGVLTSSNPTAATSATTGAIVVGSGGISSLNAFVTNTNTVGSLVTTNNLDTSSSTTSPNQFNGSVGFLKQTTFDGMATFNQDVAFKSKIYYGDGSVTSVKTAQNMIVDNILLLDGAPSGAGSDSGVAMGRFQTPNDTGSGDVVNDTAAGIYLSGTVASGSNSATVINLGQTLTATQVSNLPGSWVKVVDPANTGVIMTRRIKSVTTAGIATIWAQSDNNQGSETTDAVNYGMNFTNTPTNTMTYTIYSRSFLEMVWVESAKRFRFGASPMSANTLLSNLTGLADLEASNIFGLTLNTAQINGASTGLATNVQLVNFLGNAISNVGTMNGSPVWSPPVQVTLADSSTTAVAIPGITATQGAISFMVSSVATGGSRYSTTIVSNGTSAAGPAGSGCSGTTNSGVSPNQNERVGIVWSSGSAPKLRHTAARSPSTSANLVYNVYYIVYA